MPDTVLPGVLSHPGGVQVSGQERTFLLVTAEDHSPITAVVVVLHGSSQTGKAVRAFSGHSFDHLAAAGQIAVVYPDGLKKRWNHNDAANNTSDDIAFMEALTDQLHARYGPVPLVMVGFSNGGQFLIRLVHEMPGRLHGVGIIGATLPWAGNSSFRDNYEPLPILLVHGTHDLVVPYRGEGWFRSLFGRRRGPSALETAQYFAARNGITTEPSSTVLPHRKESGRTSVTLRRFQQNGCPEVRLYTVAGGGHVVPNRHRKAIIFAGRTTQDISVADALRDFFPVLGS
ncbi:alpha/beta hydrolase family esterase [Arthrobacter psychrolactophilus]